MPRLETSRTPNHPKILSAEQQSFLLDSLNNAGNRRDATLILIVLKTGLKSAEVCGLNVADVFKNNQVVTALTVCPETEAANNGTARCLPLRIYLGNRLYPLFS